MLMKSIFIISIFLVQAGLAEGSGPANECDNWQTLHPEWIFCDDFESDTAMVRDGRYFEYDNDDGDFIVTDGVGLEDSKGMRVIFQAGEVSAGSLHLGFGRVPQDYFDQGIRNTEDFRDIYYRMYLKMQDGWVGSPAKLSRATCFASSSSWAQAMIAHLWSSGDYLAVDPASGVENGVVVTTRYNDFENLHWLGYQAGVTPIFDSQHDDTWFCIEHHIKLNDPGQSNGVQEFWIDGNPEASKTVLNFVDTWTDYAINAIFLENYWNGGSSQLQERYFDNFVVSTQPIGPAVPEPEPQVVSLEIVGPNDVAENFQSQYEAVAVYDDGSSIDVTGSANWSVDDETIASINAGLLTTEEIDLPQVIIIAAEYTEGENTQIAEKEVSIFTICPSGSALEFDGSNGVYIEGSGGTGSVLNIYNSNLTLSAWVKPATVPAQGAILARYKTLSGAYRLGISSGNAYINTYLKYSGHWVLNGGSVLEAGTWYHVVGVFDRYAGIGQVYINGIEDAKGTLGPSPLSNDAITRIGCRQDTSDSTFNGLIDDVRIYNRALSAEEIQASMHTKLTGDEDGLVAYWDFDEGEGEIACDSSGNGNDGTLVGAAWVESDAPVGSCINLAIDIKPGSCPNPLNVKSSGVLPVAVLGSEDFDVVTIEAASIRLAGVAPVRSSYEDVATAMTEGNECECNMESTDGYTDLTLKFKTQEIVAVLGEVNHGEVLGLTIEGLLSNGTVVQGMDCILVVGKHKPINKADINKDGMVNIIDFGVMADNWLQSSIIEK